MVKEEFGIWTENDGSLHVRHNGQTILFQHDKVGEKSALALHKALSAFLQEGKTVLTAGQQQVYDVLDDEFHDGYTIANRAHIHTSSPRETAAKFCIQLVKLGLAQKGGSAQFPEWRRAPKVEV